MSNHDETELKRISPRLPGKLHKELKVSSINQGLTMEQAVVEAIEDWLSKQKSEQESNKTKA
jgi:uncharacterized protein (DUF2267 family)